MTTELQHIGQYVRQLKPYLPKEVFEPVPTRLFWMIPYLGGPILIALLIIFTDWSLWIKIPLSLVMGQLLGGLGFLGHEILHGSVVKTPWLRDFLGSICFVIFGTSAKLWRKWHNVDHHGQTQKPGIDPDAFETFDKYDQHFGFKLLRVVPHWMRPPITLFSYTFWFSSLSFVMLRHYYADLTKDERKTILLQTAIPWLFWLSLLPILGFSKFLLVFILPAMSANFLVIGYIATNHLLCPLTETNDPLENSLSIRNPKWVDWLHLNFAYHVEHHIFPSVNPVHAPKIQALLKRFYPEKYHAWSWPATIRALLATPRSYGLDLITLRGHDSEFGTVGHNLDPYDLKPLKKLDTNQHEANTKTVKDKV